MDYEEEEEEYSISLVYSMYHVCFMYRVFFWCCIFSTNLKLCTDVDQGLIYKILEVGVGDPGDIDFLGGQGRAKMYYLNV